MRGRHQRSSPAKVEPQTTTAYKKPRGRPRKHFNEGENGSGSQGRDIRPLLEKVLARKKITHLKDALEQLDELHQYVIDSIEFGEYAGYKKCTADELEHILSEMFKT